MRGDVMAAGAMFALLTLAPAWRGVAGGARVAHDPVLVMISVAAAARALWARRPLRTAVRP
ncbi:MAG: hypothetical protein KGJ44_05655 [Betaproteobacteria bacterium]|nr:hypothetical protein [Betaproteobacteria bacterium]